MVVIEPGYIAIDIVLPSRHTIDIIDYVTYTFYLSFLSTCTLLLFVAGESPVVNGQSTGELSTVACSKS